MAKAKKKSKAKKSAKKSKAKPVKKKAKKSVKRAAAKAPAKAKKSKKVAAKTKKPAKKTAPKKKKKQIVGEGDYAASRKFDKDQTSFVERNKAKIPAMGKAAEAALDGPEGDSIRAAEQEAMNRSVIE